MCAGKGNWTMNPSTVGSLLSSSILLSSSPCETSAGYLISEERNPISWQAFTLAFTYVMLAPLSPTRIATRCGGRCPAETICSTSRRSSSRTCAEVFFPSSISIVYRVLFLFVQKKALTSVCGRPFRPSSGPWRHHLRPASSSSSFSCPRTVSSGGSPRPPSDPTHGQCALCAGR